MDDSIAVQILEALRKLKAYLSNSFFTNIEVSGRQIVEKVRSFHIVEYYIVVVNVFKNINQIDNIWMLAHFQNFYFSSLLKNFNMSHVLFLNLLYSNLLPCLLVSRQFDKSKLTFSERFFKAVKIKNIRVTHSFLQPHLPAFFVLLVFEVKKPRFVRRYNNLQCKIFLFIFY